MAEQSRYQRIQRIMAIIVIVLSIIGVVNSILAMNTTPMANLIANNPNLHAQINELLAKEGVTGTVADELGVASTVVITTGVVALVSCALEFIVGILALRGSKNPLNNMPCFVFALFSLVCSLIGLVVVIVNTMGSGYAAIAGEMDMASKVIGQITRVVLMGVCVWLAGKVNQQASLMKRRHESKTAL